MEINHINSTALLIVMPMTILVLLWWGFARVRKKSASGIKVWQWPYIIGLLVFVPYAGLAMKVYYNMMTSSPKKCKKFYPDTPAPNIVEAYGFWTYWLYDYVPYHERPFCPNDQKAFEKFQTKKKIKDGMAQDPLYIWRRTFDALTDINQADIDDFLVIPEQKHILYINDLIAGFYESATAGEIVEVKRYSYNKPENSTPSIYRAYAAIDKIIHDRNTIRSKKPDNENFPGISKILKWGDQKKITVTLAIEGVPVEWPERETSKDIEPATREQVLLDKVYQSFARIADDLERATGKELAFQFTTDKTAFYTKYDGDIFAVADITLNFRISRTTADKLFGRDAYKISMDGIDLGKGKLFETFEVEFPLISAHYNPRFTTKGVSVINADGTINHSICNTPSDFFVLNGVLDEYVRKCLVSALGIRDKSHRIQGFQHELLLLTLLYYPGITPGMDANTATPIIRQAITEKKVVASPD